MEGTGREGGRWTEREKQLTKAENEDSETRIKKETDVKREMESKTERQTD